MALAQDFDAKRISDVEDYEEGLTEYKTQSMNRSQFHKIFRFLADAIDPKHFEDCPVIFINGFGGTWKSLVADIMIRSFDDIALFEGKKGDDFDPSEKFSAELRACEASECPAQIKTLSAGKLAHFFFRSGFGYGYSFNLKETVRELNPARNKRGVIFCSGDTEEHDSKILDIFIEHDYPKGIHTIKIMPTNDVLLNCPRFSAYMNVLNNAEHVGQLVAPDPESWRQSITPDIS